MRRFPLLLLAAGLLLAACQVSLAGDITPPPGSELQQQAATAEAVIYPEATPNPDNGAITYAQSCVPCHGETGLGDGPQSGQLPVAVPAIADPDVVHASSPDAWFTIVSQGNLDSFMPPFAESLTVQQRWDVLAYVYSLGLEDADLAAGQAIAEQFDLPSGGLENRAALSLDDWAAQLAADLELSEQEALSAAAYLLAGEMGIAIPEADVELDSEPEEAGDALPTDEAEAPAEDDETDVVEEGVRVAGQVGNGSGGDLPGDAEVLLRGFDQSSEVFNRSTPLENDGSYLFEGLVLDQGLVYATTIEYEGLIYFSEAIQPDGEQSQYDLPLTVYDTTSETDALSIDHLQLILDFSGEGSVRVVSLVSIINRGDLAVVPAAEDEPVLSYALPPEASNLAFESGVIGERYLPTEDGFGDLRAVLPGSGEYQMLYAYQLPYSRSLDFEVPLTLAADAISIFSPAEGPQFSSPDFVLLGNQQLESEIYTGYQSQVAFEAGDNLSFELDGAHPLGVSNPLLDLVNQDDFLVGLLALILAVGAAWLWLRRLNAAGPNPDEIMDAIVALDNRYAEDQIAEDSYLKRRAALKERLRRALAQPGKPRP